MVFMPSNAQDATRCPFPSPYPSMVPKIDKLNDTYGLNSTLEMKCRPGYMNTKQKSPFLLCNENGTWTIIGDTCVKKRCIPPPDILHGHIEISSSNPLEFGSVIHITCNTGYNLVGASTIICLLITDSHNSVAWDKEFPTCVPQRCKPPQVKSNVMFNPLQEEYEYREAIRYSCSGGILNGLKLVGKEVAFCSEHGNWTNENISCVPKNCPKPVISHGYLLTGSKYKYTFQDFITIRCSNGYRLIGSPTSTCSLLSTWDPPLPTCIYVPQSTTTPTRGSTTTSTSTWPAVSHTATPTQPGIQSTPSPIPPEDLGPTTQPPPIIETQSIKPRVLAVLVYLGSAIGVLGVIFLIIFECRVVRR